MLRLPFEQVMQQGAVACTCGECLPGVGCVGGCIFPIVRQRIGLCVCKNLFMQRLRRQAARQSAEARGPPQAVVSALRHQGIFGEHLWHARNMHRVRNVGYGAYLNVSALAPQRI